MLQEEQRPENTGRYVLDQISMVTETIGQYSAGPTQVVADWIQDQIAPPYWVTKCILREIKLLIYLFEQFLILL